MGVAGVPDNACTTKPPHECLAAREGANTGSGPCGGRTTRGYQMNKKLTDEQCRAFALVMFAMYLVLVIAGMVRS